MFKKVRAYLISWTYANKLHTFFMMLCGFKIKKSSFFLLQLIVIKIVDLHGVSYSIQGFGRFPGAAPASDPDLSGIAFYSLKV